jgi:hypothetical protein
VGPRQQSNWIKETDHVNACRDPGLVEDTAVTYAIDVLCTETLQPLCAPLCFMDFDLGLWDSTCSFSHIRGDFIAVSCRTIGPKEGPNNVVLMFNWRTGSLVLMVSLSALLKPSESESC